jgi:hypothetical protein
MDFAWEESPSIGVHAKEGKWKEVERPQQMGERGYAIARRIKHCGRRPGGGDLLLSDHLQLVEVG